jgi:hypothetical protein
VKNTFDPKNLDPTRCGKIRSKADFTDRIRILPVREKYIQSEKSRSDPM